MRGNLLAGLLLLCCTLTVLAAEPLLQPWPHAQQVSHSSGAEVDYLLGLGALQKVGGRWRHKRSEIISGELERSSWLIAEAYTADEAYQWYRQQLVTEAELLFECQGRDCGSSAQWADQVFQERILYGHEARQRYSAWRLQRAEESWLVVLYSVDRANRRYYIHIDQLREAASD